MIFIADILWSSPGGYEGCRPLQFLTPILVECRDILIEQSATLIKHTVVKEAVYGKFKKEIGQ